jgi:hypothetical protein
LFRCFWRYLEQCQIKKVPFKTILAIKGRANLVLIKMERGMEGKNELCGYERERVRLKGVERKRKKVC